MNVLDTEEMVVEIQEQPVIKIDRVRFEKDWKNAMSSDEFWKRACKHIEEVYAARNRQ